MVPCERCGAPFSPLGSAWGGKTCGDCIAAEIEFLLAGGLLGTDRKPMIRAHADRQAEPEQALDAESRQELPGRRSA
jgi:hypothetical protein